MERIQPFEEEFGRYDNWYEKFPGKKLYSIELNCLKRLSYPISKWSIEMGVGTGRFAHKLGIRYGLDPAFNPLLIAKRRNISVIHADGRMTPFKNNIFDQLFLIVTVCFADEPCKLIQEAHRVLRPGGKILIGFVPRDSTWGDYYLKLKKEGHIFYRYATFFTVEEMFSILNHTGFQNVTGLSTLYGPPPTGYEVEEVREEIDERAGFICIRAEKIA